MNGEKPKAFSTSIPRMNELRLITGKIFSTEAQCLSAHSLHHARLLKCRWIIILLPEVIACPVQSTDVQGDIYIILTEKFLFSGVIQNRLHELNMKYYESPGDITEEIFAACLHHTILLKVAPQWNKVDEYFIQGKNFLEKVAFTTNAIKIHIVVNEKETRFYILPASVKIPLMSLGYFSLAPETIRNFITSTNGCITFDDSKSQPWIHVLPSLKKGKVISITKEMPETCPFKNYHQLRRHWKKMYGYYLPESDEGRIYYKVSFPWFEKNFFTYPSCCVRSAQLNHFPVQNEEDIVKQFLKDLTRNMSRICETPFTVKELHPDVKENNQPALN